MRIIGIIGIMSQDFSKGKIYKITNDYNDDVYVGSTCNTLVRRFIAHKDDYKRDKNKHRPLYKLMNEIGFDRFRIELLEDYPCDDKYQLRQREGYYIRLIGTYNSSIAGRHFKEWEEENKEKRAQQNKEKYEKNKVNILNRRKEFRENNKQHVSEQAKKYFELHKEKYCENITCSCGCVIQKREQARHSKSKKHQDLMHAKSSETTN